MAEMTVQDLAKEVGIAVDALLTKLDEAGIKATSGDSAISDEDKLQLLRHLRTGSGSVKLSTSGDKRISVPSRKRSQLKVSGQRGAPTRTVNVEVRKKRTYVKRAAVEEEERLEEERLAAEEQARIEAEEAAKRQAEAEEAKRKADEDDALRSVQAAKARAHPERQGGVETAS